MPALAAPRLSSASYPVRRVIFAVLWGASLARSLPVAPAAAEEAAKPPLFTEAATEKATSALDGIVDDAMKRTGLPGAAVSVV